ncbi:50S ribosomal protein L1 [Deltaproteobacteria bacterium TL4]
MKKKTKREKLIDEKVDRARVYLLTDAVNLLKDVKVTKFDETIEIALNLGVDPRKADQTVRGTCSLPNGLGKEVRVLVFTKGDKEAEAREAGADYVGAEDLVTKIQGGWFEFDRVVASPDMMSLVGRIGRLLGPRGLMPNPKLGTVTTNIGQTVGMIKAGQVEFRADKNGILQAPVGKVSFEPVKLVENIRAFVETINRLKPPASKGIYMRQCTITSSMGPGLKVDIQSIRG